MSVENELYYKISPENVSRLQEGDLLECERIGFSHWAVYAGNRKVIHKSYTFKKKPKSDMKKDIKNFFSKGIITAYVFEEDLWEQDWMSMPIYKNNQNDRKYSPLEPAEILERARSQIGPLKFAIFSNNCEHFANWCRYGESFSDQVDAFMGDINDIADDVALELKELINKVQSKEKEKNTKKRKGCEIL